jgi:hypothetical protein
MAPVALAVSALLLLLPVPSAGNEIRVSLTLSAIQNALTNAQPGDIVVVDQGTLDLGSATLTITKAGVSLRGAGQRKTIFQSSQTGLPRLLDISGSPVDTPTGVPATVIEGITFLNSALTVPFEQDIGPEGAIQIRVSGPRGSQSVIRNCEFLNFVTTIPPQVNQLAAVDLFGAARWRIEGNRFDGLT